MEFWVVPNYGTFAQAYALERTMNKLFPHRDSKQIAYLNKKHYDNYYNKRIGAINSVQQAFCTAKGM